MSEQKPVATEDFFKGAKPIIVYTQAQLDALLKAEREKAIRASVLFMEPDFNEEQIKSIVDEILSTDESKENG